LGAGFVFDGDINLASSKVHTLADGGLGSGGIDLFAPGGQVLVGYSSATDTDRAKAATRGLVTYRGGSIRSFSDGDFQVNTQKAFVVGEGDLMLYTRQGAIDSGRGSNTDVTVPAPVPVVDPSTGAVVFRSPAVTTGSGIGLLKQRDGTSQGTV
ncbi:filamentous haemagglutinin family protein, partial [Enterobacter hormaechei]|uniref:filamentous haemagglutinin family protein n=2 Tax=Pseudomonadota TaxID=1224 RepID=UPI00197F99E9